MEPKTGPCRSLSHTRRPVKSTRLALVVVGALSSACVTTSASSGFVPAAHREPDLVTASGEVRHRVEKGQTLYRIARTYGLSVDELMRANAIDDPRELKVGEWLRIPGAEAPKAKVVEADSPEPTPPARPAAATPEKKAPKVLTKVGTSNGPLSWPIRGVLYARFGRKGKEPHDGIDLAAPAGTPVKTAAPGTTLYAGEQKGYGLIVIVEHAGGLITLYAHNRDVRVKTGQKVREGQVVATVGDSGKTSGPHLHFEVRKDGVPVDPLLYLGPVPPPDSGRASPAVSAER
jgi:murein DD-endopeptidase MepM/ murein hydrolase activator NlpD